MKRILVVGHGRAGKDTAAEILSRITGIPYAGSTSWAAKEMVAEVLGVHTQKAWDERHQHRDDWKRICDKLREEDQTLLARIALRSVNNKTPLFSNWRGIVAGVRDKKELNAIRREEWFDCILWIDRPGILLDPTVTFDSSDCDETILNDGTIEKLASRLYLWAEKQGLIPSLYLSGKCPTIDQHRE